MIENSRYLKNSGKTLPSLDCIQPLPPQYDTSNDTDDSEDDTKQENHDGRDSPERGLIVGLYCTGKCKFTWNELEHIHKIEQSQTSIR